MTQSVILLGGRFMEEIHEVETDQDEIHREECVYDRTDMTNPYPDGVARIVFRLRRPRPMNHMT